MSEFTVLLVDDEEDFRRTLAKRLEKRNLQVLSAAGGEEAMALIRRSAVDVVALDVRMPGMDGIDVLRAIKAHDPLIEVVMLTGHASVEAAVEGMDFGAFDYLMKPVGIDELLYKLQDAYEARRIGLKRNSRGPTPSE
ncbi:MAG: response regulator [Desulfobacterales bacterium]|nr:response regulator [Desulfobacterales bacterium]